MTIIGLLSEIAKNIDTLAKAGNHSEVVETITTTKNSDKVVI